MDAHSELLRGQAMIATSSLWVPDITEIPLDGYDGTPLNSPTVCVTKPPAYKQYASLVSEVLTDPDLFCFIRFVRSAAVAVYTEIVTNPL